MDRGSPIDGISHVVVGSSGSTVSHVVDSNGIRSHAASTTCTTCIRFIYMMSKWTPLALACLLGGWSVRAVSPTREIEIVNDSVELWLPLHGDDPLSNNILSGENIDANVRPGGDPSFVEDRWFGAVFQCGPLSSLAIEGFGESAAGSLSPSSFSVSFWFRTNTSTGGSGAAGGFSDGE